MIWLFIIYLWHLLATSVLSINCVSWIRSKSNSQKKLQKTQKRSTGPKGRKSMELSTENSSCVGTTFTDAATTLTPSQTPVLTRNKKHCKTRTRQTCEDGSTQPSSGVNASDLDVARRNKVLILNSKPTQDAAHQGRKQLTPRMIVSPGRHSERVLSEKELQNATNYLARMRSRRALSKEPVKADVMAESFDEDAPQSDMNLKNDELISAVDQITVTGSLPVQGTIELKSADFTQHSQVTKNSAVQVPNSQTVMLQVGHVAQ